MQKQPDIQPYSHLAGEYDELRYVSASDVVKEKCREGALTALIPRQCERALDVACGTGRGVLLLSESSTFVVGLDGTAEMLRIARAKSVGGRTAYCLANAARMPFSDATFDLVTCLNFLHLFRGKEDRAAFVAEIARVVRPGGTVVLEFDNVLQGLVLGLLRKHFVKDIGYDWPWTAIAALPRDQFGRRKALGANVPFVWRFEALSGVERLARSFPGKYLAGRLFISAVRL